LFHPADQDVLLLRRERAMQFRRRHHIFLVLAQDTLHQRAVLDVARHHRGVAALQHFRRAGELIETKTSLTTFIGVRSVTTVAAVRKDRAHLAIEVHWCIGCVSDGYAEQAEQGSGVRGAHQGC